MDVDKLIIFIDINCPNTEERQIIINLLLEEKSKIVKGKVIVEMSMDKWQEYEKQFPIIPKITDKLIQKK